MAIRTLHKITDNTWFITFTCYKWIPLFEITRSYDLVYNWLKLAEEKYHIKTLAFVIMPNHVHLLLYLTDEKVNLNIIISNAKRFMAYAIIERLTQSGNINLLETLGNACTGKEKAKGQLHKAFEPSFDAKPVYTIAFLHQKMDYIHHNLLAESGTYVPSLQIISIAAPRFIYWKNNIASFRLRITGIFGVNATQGPRWETLRGQRHSIALFRL